MDNYILDHGNMDLRAEEDAIMDEKMDIEHFDKAEEGLYDLLDYFEGILQVTDENQYFAVQATTFDRGFHCILYIV